MGDCPNQRRAFWQTSGMLAGGFDLNESYLDLQANTASSTTMVSVEADMLFSWTKSFVGPRVLGSTNFKRRSGVGPRLYTTLERKSEFWAALRKFRARLDPEVMTEELSN